MLTINIVAMHIAILQLFHNLGDLKIMCKNMKIVLALKNVIDLARIFIDCRVVLKLNKDILVSIKVFILHSIIF